MGFEIWGTAHLGGDIPPFIGWDSPEHPAFTYGDPPKWCGCASCDCGLFPRAHK